MSDMEALDIEMEALNKVERLLRKAERDARLLDGREFKFRPWAEAYRLLDMLREQAQLRDEEKVRDPAGGREGEQ